LPSYEAETGLFGRRKRRVWNPEAARMGTTRAGRPRRHGRLALNGRRLRVNRAALHEQAAGRLRHLIVQGDLAPGAALGEAELSEALGISRTPLREALKLLAAEGLIELRPNRSARIVPLRPEEVNELFEAVGGVERVAAELAATRITRRELQRLRSLQARMERHHEAGELEDYFQLNQQIHGLIVAAAKNGVLKATHEWLLGRVERARYFALSSRDRWDRSVEEHREILAALEAGDAQRAGETLARHVRRTGQVVNEILSRRPDAAGDPSPPPAVGPVA
jgi:DNA-binding GntR family transcriptional regulator